VGIELADVSVGVAGSGGTGDLGEPGDVRRPLSMGRVGTRGAAPPAGSRMPLLRLLRSRKVLLAAALTLVGSVCIVMAILLFAGVSPNFENRAVALLILGLLIFIPGSYMSTIAYKAWRGERGFSFHLIPDV
jgi:hypothetical protein